MIIKLTLFSIAIEKINSSTTYERYVDLVQGFFKLKTILSMSALDKLERSAFGILPICGVILAWFLSQIYSLGLNTEECGDHDIRPVLWWSTSLSQCVRNKWSCLRWQFCPTVPENGRMLDSRIVSRYCLRWYEKQIRFCHHKTLNGQINQMNSNQSHSIQFWFSCYHSNLAVRMVYEKGGHLSGLWPWKLVSCYRCYM